MGLPGVPTEHEITEAIACAREAIAAVTNDEESWFDRLMACTSRGFEHTNDHELYDTYRAALFVMMQELARSRQVVLVARAEIRLNGSASPALVGAVTVYENAENDDG